MQTLTERLHPYLPHLIVRRIQAQYAPAPGGDVRSSAQLRLRTPAQPEVHHLQAAVLFLDMSGFTRLAEQYARLGATGVEALLGQLTASFAPIIELILDYGGDVVKFAGDALLVLWPVMPEPSPDSAAGKGEAPPVAGLQPSMSAAIAQATRCGRAIQTGFHAREVEAGVTLSFRVSIACGEVEIRHLGGVRGRWELLVTGAAVHQAARLNLEAQPGDVVISAVARTLTETLVRGSVLPSGSLNVSAVRTRRLEAPALPQLPEPLNPESVRAVMRAWIPGAVLARMEAGQDSWLGELRRVSVLFVQLHSVGPESTLEWSQQLIERLQQVLYRYEGSLNKLSTDDKGLLMVAALGLPPLAHEDDAVRAVQAALDLRTELVAMQCSFAIGIASGLTFCGAFGSARRHEYTMLGDVVNLAARLMQEAQGDILCDFNTFQAARSRVDWTPLPPRKIKGKRDLVPLFRPLSVDRQRTAQAAAGLVGRTEERLHFEQCLTRLDSGMSMGTTLLEGEAGIGKSTLLAHLRRQARGHKVQVLLGVADAVESNTPLFAWRWILRQLFGLELDTPLQESRQRVQQVLDRLSAHTHLDGLASLLNTVLPLDFPETAASQALSQSGRADSLREMLASLLSEAARETPVVLILEDAHWLDSASWGLALSVRRRVQPLWLVLSTRPADRPLSLEASQLLLSPDVTRLSLNRLAPEDIVALVCRRLGVTSLPPPVAELLQRRAEGHPFFAEELTHALQEREILRVEQGRCLITRPDLEEACRTLPDTIQGVITSRIDRLSPTAQLTVKVASVIGRIFTFRLLSDIFPVKAQTEELPTHLAALQTVDITQLEAPEPELSYLFKHVITQEVAYNLMLFAQRRTLHEAVAKWYERQPLEDLGAFFPLLAWHWQQAQVIEKAMDYLCRAGEQALSQAAYQEAARFLHEGLALMRQQPTPPHAHARTERLYAEALIGIGRVEDGRLMLEQSLGRLTGPVPTTQGAWLRHLLGLVGQLALRRLLPASAVARPEPGPTALEQLSLLASLEHTYYFVSEFLPSMVMVLRRYLLARAVALPNHLAPSLGVMVMVCGGFQQHGLAGQFIQEAEAIAANATQTSAQVRTLLPIAMYLVMGGRQDEAYQRLVQAVTLSRRLGDHRLQLESLGILSWVHIFRGQIGQARGLSEEIYTLARLNGDVQGQLWGQVGHVYHGLLTGDLPGAAQHLSVADQLPTYRTSVAEGLWVEAARLLTLALLGEHTRAVAGFEALVPRIRQLPRTSLNLQVLQSCFSLARMRMLTWLADPERQLPSPTSLLGLKDLIRLLERSYPSVRIMTPSSHLLWHLYHRCVNQPRRSLRFLELALSSAETLRLPVEAAQLRLRLALFVGATTPRGLALKTQAEQALQALGLPLTVEGEGNSGPRGLQGTDRRSEQQTA